MYMNIVPSLSVRTDHNARVYNVLLSLNVKTDGTCAESIKMFDVLSAARLPIVLYRLSGYCACARLDTIMKSMAAAIIAAHHFKNEIAKATIILIFSKLRAYALQCVSKNVAVTQRVNCAAEDDFTELVAHLVFGRFVLFLFQVFEIVFHRLITI